MDSVIKENYNVVKVFRSNRSQGHSASGRARAKSMEAKLRFSAATYQTNGPLTFTGPETYFEMTIDLRLSNDHVRVRIVV